MTPTLTPASLRRGDERAALASGRGLGRGDVKAAEDSASTACAGRSTSCPSRAISSWRGGIGEARLRWGRRSARGARLRSCRRPARGRSVRGPRRGGRDAMIAVGDAGTFPRLPDMYMRKMAVGRSHGVGSTSQAGRGQCPRDRGGLRTEHEPHHLDRPRPSPSPRFDRGDRAVGGRIS